MTFEEACATQAKEILELKMALNDYRERIREIRSTLYCIGGPLNDNFLQFSHAQLKPFFDIAQSTEGCADRSGEG